MQIRIVSNKEIEECPALRLDAEHYIPLHKTWECEHGAKLRIKGALVTAFLLGKITSEQLKLAMQYV